MYYKIIPHSLFLIFIFILQLSFVSALPWWLNSLNLILISLIFILVYFDFKIAAIWSLGMGALLDFYSFQGFGLHILSLFLVVLLANFILVNFITNQSLYSFLALIIFSLVFFQISLQFLAYFFDFLNSSYLALLFTRFFWFDILKQVLSNAILTTLIFYSTSFVSNRFKPVFLIRNKN